MPAHFLGLPGAATLATHHYQFTSRASWTTWSSTRRPA